MPITLQSWTTDRSKLEELIAQVKKDAKTGVKTGVASNTAKRNFTRSIYDFIITLIPIAEFNKLRKMIRESGADINIFFPQEILDFLEEHRIAKPHLNSKNPFMGLFNQFWLEASQDLGYISGPVAKKLIADASTPDNDEQVKFMNRVEGDVSHLRVQNPDGSAKLTDLAPGITEEDAVKYKKERRNAVYQSNHKYSTVLLAAIDMEDPDALDRGVNGVIEEYAKWRKNPQHLSIAYAPVVETVEGGKAKRKTEKMAPAISEEAGEKQSMRDELGRRMMDAAGHDPLVETVMLDGTDAITDVTLTVPPDDPFAEAPAAEPAIAAEAVVTAEVIAAGAEPDATAVIAALTAERDTLLAQLAEKTAPVADGPLVLAATHIKMDLKVPAFMGSQIPQTGFFHFAYAKRDNEILEITWSPDPAPHVYSDTITVTATEAAMGGAKSKGKRGKDKVAAP